MLNKRKIITVCEICFAVRDVVGRESFVEGAQRIGGLWRVYMADVTARAQVLATGINLRDTIVTLHDKKPYLHP